MPGASLSGVALDEGNSSMNDEVQRPPILYVPWSPDTPGWSIEKANRQGAAWPAQQAGSKLVLVSSTQNYQQNAVANYTRDAVVAKPPTLWKSNWPGGRSSESSPPG